MATFSVAADVEAEGVFDSGSKQMDADFKSGKM